MYRTHVLLSLQGANPHITRGARRLYIGNLPMGCGLTTRYLQDFFAQVVTQIITTPMPVLSVWLSPEEAFCVRSFVCCALL